MSPHNIRMHKHRQHIYVISMEQKIIQEEKIILIKNLTYMSCDDDDEEIDYY